MWRIISVLIIAILLAVGQGFFELFAPSKSISEAIHGINTTWLVACAVTTFGVLLTGEYVWNVVLKPRTPEASLSAALKVTVRSLELLEDINPRVAIYVAYPTSGAPFETLFQEFPYVYAYEQETKIGMGASGLSEHVGIVGHVFRMGEEYNGLCTYLDNSNSAVFRSLLVAPPWNFSREQAALVDQSRPSYMAFRFRCPSGGRKRPLEGVIFFDAKGEGPQFDDEMVAWFADELLDVVVGYISECFGSRYDG